MKKVATIVLSLLFVFLSLQYGETTKGQAPMKDDQKMYTVQKGDTSYKIAVKFGISELELNNANAENDVKIEKGEKIYIPKPSVTKQEKELLARLVHAEAEGEPYKGKVAVASVVLNRVENEDFPDTIKEVIYEKRQFEPVANGSINEPAGEDAKKAVNEALALQGQGTESLYFFNPDQTSSKWLRTKTVTEVIGNHRFAI